MIRNFAAGVVLAVSAMTSPETRAQDAGVDPSVRPTIADLQRQIDDLKSRIAERDGQQATPAAPAAPLAVRKQASTPRIVHGANVLAAPVDQPVQSPGVTAAFQLTGGTAGKRAELLLSQRASRPKLGARVKGRAIYDTFSVAASAPLADEGPTSIGTLASLEDGFALKLRYTSYHETLEKPAAAVVRRWLHQARAACMIRHEALAAVDAKTICEGDPDPVFLKEYLGDAAFAKLQADYFGSVTLAWGVEATLGYRNFEYLDPLTAAETDSSRWPIGGKVFLSYFPGGGTTAITGSIAYENSYKAAKSGSLCPAPTGPFTSCLAGAIGGPSRTKRYIVSLGERSYIPLNDFLIPGFAIAPSVNYEIEEETFGLDLPVYLVPDIEGNLIGGLRFGYKSDGDDISFGIFVGTTFSLFQ